jgi:hypothetical protein
MPETKDEKFVITAEQYEGLAGPPLVLPTPGELFEFEVETLVGHKLATYGDADAFRNRALGKGLFLFVPAPPEVLDLDHLMSLVSLDGGTGLNYPVARIKPAITVPATASLLIGIDDGRGRLNNEANDSRRKISREKRHPYDVWRGIIHASLFPTVLKHHYLNLVGSRHCDVGEASPLLCIVDNRPALTMLSDDIPCWNSGAPSAREILVP